jgi:hypothetical protein
MGSFRMQRNQHRLSIGAHPVRDARCMIAEDTAVYPINDEF